MTSTAIFGGTGYAGSHIAEEARKRGFDVTIISRNASGERAIAGSIEDASLLKDLAVKNDVLISAVHPGTLIPALDELISAAESGNARIGVVGGAGTSLVSEGGPELVDTPEFPEEYKEEALNFRPVLSALQASPESVDWFFVHPAVLFGAYAPGETTGQYRTGGDVVVWKQDGSSEISGTDYAVAFVDEIEKPAHNRQRFTVGH